MSATVRELQFRVGFVPDGSIAKVGGDVRKELAAIKQASIKEYGLRGGADSVARTSTSYQTNEIAAAAKQTAFKEAQAAIDRAGEEKLDRINYYAKKLAANEATAAKEKLDRIMYHAKKFAAAEREAVALESKARLEAEASAARVHRNWEDAEFAKFKEDEKVKAEAGKRGPLSGLKDAFGRGSTFGGLAKVAAGGGAILGLQLAAQEVEKISGKIVEMNDKMRDGTASAGDMVFELGRSIPIVGELAKAYDNIEELFTHRLAHEREITEEAQRQTESIKEHARIRQAERAEHEGLRVSIRAAQQEQARTGLEGPSQGIASARDAMKNRQEDAPRKLRDENEAIRKARQDVIDKDIENVEKLRARERAASEGPEFQAAQRDREGAEKGILRAKIAMQREISDHTAEFWENEKAQDAKGEAEVQSLTEERARQRIEEFRATNERIADIRDEAQAGSLRDAGKGLDADLLLLKHGMDKQIAEVDRALEEKRRKIKADTSDGAPDALRIAAAEEQAEKQKQAIRDREANQVQAAGRKDAQDRESRQAEVSRFRIESIDAELAAGNHAHEAEKARLEIQNQYIQKRVALERMLTDERTGGAARKQLQIQLDGLGAEEKQTIAARTNLDIENDKLSILQAQASAGSNVARVAAGRLEIQRKFKEERQKLQGQFDDPNATNSQKKQIAQMMRDLGGAESAQLAKLTALPLGAYAAETRLNNFGGNTGIVADAREKEFATRFKGFRPGAGPDGSTRGPGGGPDGPGGAAGLGGVARGPTNNFQMVNTSKASTKKVEDLLQKQIEIMVAMQNAAPQQMPELFGDF